MNNGPNSKGKPVPFLSHPMGLVLIAATGVLVGANAELRKHRVEHEKNYRVTARAVVSDLGENSRISSLSFPLLHECLEQ